jgi:acetoin utilization protein AcuB
MRVAELMKPRVETVSVGESAELARQRMRQKRIRHLVVTSGRDVVGVVSDRDLEEAGSLRRVQTVGEVMTSPVVTARPETTLRQAANLLRGRAIGCLPVLEDGRLVGIVTTTDLLELVGRGAERPVAKSRRFILKGRGPRRKKFSARA